MKIIKLKEYQQWLEKRNLSPETIVYYSWGLENFGTRELNTENIVSFFKKNLVKYKPKSLKLCRAALASYAKFEKITIEWELITRLIPTVQQKFLPTINENELQQLKQVRTKTKLTTNRRNNLILDFLFYTGIRVKELVNIRHRDYQNGSLWIRGKGNKDRYIFIPNFLIRYFNSGSDYLFKSWKDEKINNKQVRKIIRCRVKEAGLTKHITPRTFRRSFATLLNNRNCKLTAIQKFLGHSDINTTTNYIHNSREELYQEYSKLWTSVGGAKNSLNSTPPPPLLSIS